MARNSYFNENTLEELLEEIKYVYQSDKRPWVIGYSGGKDSTTVVELVYKMLQMLPKEERNKNVYIVSSDTLIENPLIKIYLSKMNKLLGEAAKKDDLPIISTMVTPPADNSFWANVIGRGFPTPRINGTFRWCTDRLKINPSANYIRNVIKKEGEEVVVLLGVRKAESEARRRRIEGRELANRLMNRHETIQDAYVYNPIVELTTEDVWEVLLRLDGGKTPWGSNNNELVSLYAGADSGECPFAGIHAGGQTQSCGNSRFGCWVCTVVKEDKSLNGFIKSGHRELIPLAEFRSWLMSIRDNEEYREKKRRNGTVYRDKQKRLVKMLNGTSINVLKNKSEVELGREPIQLYKKIELGRLSKGERQIFILALYWAIIEISGQNIPFIIDTPYARIDANHRREISEKFFPNISDQVIILSTDEEINEEYYKIIKPYISKEYLLINDENENRTTIENNYFFEV